MSRLCLADQLAHSEHTIWCVNSAIDTTATTAYTLTTAYHILPTSYHISSIPPVLLPSPDSIEVANKEESAVLRRASARCPVTTATRRCGWACFRCATTRRSLPCIGCGEARGCRRRICCSIHGVGRSSRVGEREGKLIGMNREWMRRWVTGGPVRGRWRCCERTSLKESEASSSSR